MELKIKKTHIKVQCQSQTLHAFASGKELVDGHPKIAVRLALLLCLVVVENGRDPRVLAFLLHRQPSGEARRQNADVVRVVFVLRPEAAHGRVVVWTSRADARDPGTRERKIGLAAIDGIRGGAIIGAKDHDAHLRPSPILLDEPRQRNRREAKNEVLDHIQFGQGRKALKRTSPMVACDERTCQRVVQQARRRLR